MIYRSLFAFLLLCIPALASAHEHRILEINGKTYDITMGSLNEPVVIDDKTGVEMNVWEIGTGALSGGPVIGLEETLKVEIRANGQARMQDLTPAWGEEGSYHSIFYPTMEATYRYRLVGTINDVPVDLTFTCHSAGHDMEAMEKNTTRVEVSDGVTQIEQRGSFGCPRPKAAMGFPEQASSLHELSSGKRTGTILGATGLIAGLIGMGTGLAAWKKANRAPTV